MSHTDALRALKKVQRTLSRCTQTVQDSLKRPEEVRALELQNLLRTEQAYAANARVLSAVDELLATLLGV